MKGEIKMKFLVIGAGMIGTTIAIDLSIDNEVTLFDKNVIVLEHIKNIGYGNIDTISGEIYDENLFRPLIMKHDVVVIALPGNMAAYVAKLALYQNKPVFDISSIPNNIILDEIKKIADENHTIYVPKMGIAPGMTNFLTGRGCKDLDEVTDVKIYVGGMNMNKEEFEKVNVFGLGEPNNAFAQYFIGQSYLNPLTNPKETSLFLANVTFEPGCRNNWHIHHASKGGGQLLICTAGYGWYQEEGKEAVSLEPGKVITIPANVKHWHGAKKDSYFSHIAIEVPGEDTSNEWCEPVSDEEYNKLG